MLCFGPRASKDDLLLLILALEYRTIFAILRMKDVDEVSTKNLANKTWAPKSGRGGLQVPQRELDS